MMPKRTKAYDYTVTIEDVLDAYEGLEAENHKLRERISELEAEIERLRLELISARAILDETD